MTRSSLTIKRFVGALLPLIVFKVNAIGQSERVTDDGSMLGYLYLILFGIAAIALGLAFYLWRKSKQGEDQPQYNYINRYKNYHGNARRDMDGVDAVKELEWLRKAKKSNGKAHNVKSRPTNGVANPPVSIPKAATAIPDLDFDTKIFQEKMRKLQYAQLPINSFSELSLAKLYTPLPLSNDESLINAIDQANEEYEEDEMVRGLAVKILTAFRTRNSVESLSQLALYDLSANLRSKAVTTLTEFDHESVFETILLACADPTREVRAAAARGLFRLNFDRADAWKRIMETNDVFRMSHAVRAAIESGIVLKSFDRLIHEDLKVAYEAFALVSLLVKTGETKEIFESIQNHRDERVRFALLHVLKVSRDERTLEQLQQLVHDSSLPTDVAQRVREAIASFETVAA